MLVPAASILDRVLEVIDERQRDRVRADYEAARANGPTGLSPEAQLVLAGHRAAGKSRVLPLIADASGREAVDLDRHLERVHQRHLREWLGEDVMAFRLAEREAFQSLPLGRLVSVGGGFWSHHSDTLAGHVVVEIPVSFRTYRERLLQDESRPRLRPELSLEEEIRTLYRGREIQHRNLPHWSLGRLLVELERR